MRKIVDSIRIMLLSVIIMLISCCGLSQTKRIEGNWTLSTINGATLDVYAAATGYSADLLDRNVEISGEKMVVSGADPDDTSAYGIKAVSGGYEVTGKNTVIGTVDYNEEKEILTLVLPDPEEDFIFTITLERGTYNYNES